MSTPRSMCSRSSPTRTAPSAGSTWRTPTQPRCARCSIPTWLARCSKAVPTSSAPASSCRAGRRRRADGGFQVHGRFQFGSGIARATWIGGGALVRDADGNPELNDAGMPKVLAFVVPSDSVEITGNWDVMGLRGTGSFDYSIPEQFVEARPQLLAVRRRAALRRRRVPPRCGRLRRDRPLGLGPRGGPSSARRDPGHPRLRARPHRWRADARRAGHPAGVQPEHARAALGPSARARHDREASWSASIAATP